MKLNLIDYLLNILLIIILGSLLSFFVLMVSDSIHYFKGDIIKTQLKEVNCYNKFGNEIEGVKYEERIDCVDYKLSFFYKECER